MRVGRECVFFHTVACPPTQLSQLVTVIVDNLAEINPHHGFFHLKLETLESKTEQLKSTHSKYLTDLDQAWN
jgi:hypothetical protein